MQKTFYITTPIFYPNANLHLGHAYVAIFADVLARYHRSIGESTYFLTGSDENTQNVVRAAQKIGQDPTIFLQERIENFKALFLGLAISYDQFIRTSDKVAHWPGATLLWKKLFEAGDLYKKEYEGLYCTGHEAFVTVKDLVDGKCPDHGIIPQTFKEENYFFRLSKYTELIKQKITSGELAIIPESRRKEILSVLESGLEDVSFSRPRSEGSIGIPVPGDDTQVMYVWCDALSNYVTALGYGHDGALYKKFWPADVHVIGKDILRFHAAIWPGMLLSAGLPLPKTIFVHAMIISGGKKMSKTRGNVIDPMELLKTYDSDAVRYLLTRHVSPFEDSEITPGFLHESYNAHLANGLGNQVARVMKLASEHLTEPVPLPEEALVVGEPFKKLMGEFKINEATAFIWEHIAKADAYIQETQPFKLIKSEDKKDRVEGKKIIVSLVVHIARIATHLSPIMPETSQKILTAVKENQMPSALFPRKY